MIRPLNAEEIDYIIKGLDYLADSYRNGTGPHEIIEKSIRQALKIFSLMIA